MRTNNLFFTSRNRRGFSVLELMIVVAVIGTLAAIGIPNILRARLNANEARVKSNMRAVSAAMQSYMGGQTTPSYPICTGGRGGASCWDDLTTGSTPPYLDSSWYSATSSVTKGGYTYVMTSCGSSPSFTFAVLAAPETDGTTGDFNYCMDHTGLLTTGQSVTTATGTCGPSVSGVTGCSGGLPVA